MSLKKRALRRTKTLRRDTETNEPIPPSRLSRYVARVKAPFTREFWEDFGEKSDNEQLVDGKLLSYSYLEAGVIEMLGACVLFSFYSALHLTYWHCLRVSLVGYFVVFATHGFSPSDLRRAQKVTGCA